MKAIFVGGKLNGIEVGQEELERLGNGMRSNDCSRMRAKGILCHREELDNRPKVDGYMGPMWDGDRLRYETKEVYNELSY